jgi:hypothetical protein
MTGLRQVAAFCQDVRAALSLTGERRLPSKPGTHEPDARIEDFGRLQHRAMPFCLGAART